MNQPHVPNMERLLVRPKTAAKILDCSVATIWSLIKENNGFPEPIKFGKNMVGIPYDGLIDYIKSRKIAYEK